MNSEVERFLKSLDHSRKAEIVDLATKITTSHPKYGSEIKWNAPSFTLKGINIVTFRIFPDPAFQIILHVGAKKLADSSGLQFEITELNHRWADSTRCVISVEDGLSWKHLNGVIKEWEKRVNLVI